MNAVNIGDITVSPPVLTPVDGTTISTTSKIDTESSSSFSGTVLYATVICLALVVPLLFGAAMYYHCTQRNKRLQKGTDGSNMVGTVENNGLELVDIDNTRRGANNINSTFGQSPVDVDMDMDDSIMSPKFELYSAYDDADEDIINMSIIPKGNTTDKFHRI